MLKIEDGRQQGIALLCLDSWLTLLPPGVPRTHRQGGDGQGRVRAHSRGRLGHRTGRAQGGAARRLLPHLHHRPQRRPARPRARPLPTGSLAAKISIA